MTLTNNAYANALRERVSVVLTLMIEQKKRRRGSPCVFPPSGINPLGELNKVRSPLRRFLAALEIATEGEVIPRHP